MIYAISSLITAFLSIALGLFVYVKNHREKQNQFWFLTSVSIFLWTFSLFWCFVVDDKEMALLWQKILYVGTNFIPITFFHYSAILTERNKRYQKFLWVGYIIAFIFLAMIPGDLLIKSVTEKTSIGYWPVEVSGLYYLFLVYFVVYVLMSVKVLVSGVRRYLGTKRQQVKYILYAALVGFIGGSFNFLLDFDFNYPIGNLFVSIYVFFVSYAIIKYRLMDIKLVLRKYSVYTASIVSILIPVLLLKYMGYVHVWFSFFNSLFFDVFILLMAVSVFPPLRDRYYHFANKYFFSSLYDERELVETLSEKMTSTIVIDRLFDYISEIIQGYLKSKTVSILLFDEDKREYVVRHDVGHKKSDNTSFVEDRGFYSNIILRHSVILVEELAKKYREEYQVTFDNLDKFNIDVLVPLTLKDKVIGLLALGPKESKDIYNDEDIRVLAVIGASSAIAIQNSLLFEETRNFGIKLKKEIDAATHELRDANQKLRQLDAAKSEFISIASHQLRTPLTAIKGYISMMVEGDFGKVSSKISDVLNKVYFSNERMIQLVENLLNVSRIESGKLQFIFKPTQIEPMVVSVIDELIGTAVEKGLKIDFKSPQKQLPLIDMDEEKVRQVVQNLIDNAIKYTESGEVIIRLKQKDDQVVFSVKDNGIGVTKDDLLNLFKKFSRGKKTYLVNPGGAGLGLFVAQQMIEAHNGHIWAESEGANKGSKFCFSLPVARSSQKDT